MKRLMAFTALGMALAMPVFAQPGLPAGWRLAGSNPSGYETGTEAVTGMLGRQAAYITARADAPSGNFGTMMQSFSAVPYRGKVLRLAAQMKSQDAKSAHLWVRLGGAAQRSIAISYSPDLQGTTAWQPREVYVLIPDNAERIAFGFLFQGNRGKAWIDGVRFEMLDEEAAMQVSHILRRQQRSTMAIVQQSPYRHLRSQANGGLPPGVIWTPEKGLTVAPGAPIGTRIP